ASTSQQIAQAAVAGRLAEQAQAQGQLIGALGQARVTDVDLAKTQAGFLQQANLANMSAENQRIFQQAGIDQQTSLANMQAKLAQTGLDDSATLTAMAQLFGVSIAEMQARLQLELGQLQARTQLELAEEGKPSDFDKGLAIAETGVKLFSLSDIRLKTDIKPLPTVRGLDPSFGAGLRKVNVRPKKSKIEKVGDVISAGIKALKERDKKNIEKEELQKRQNEPTGEATSALLDVPFLGLSDEDEKTNTDRREGRDSVGEMLEQLNAFSFKYKDPQKFGHGTKVGISAQDLERSELGKTFVEDTPEGKFVKFGEMLPTLLAAITQQEKRLRELEGE
ncbi:hypothetical protein LCGC14_2227760, partial [marine sediment metagenome]